MKDIFEASPLERELIFLLAEIWSQKAFEARDKKHFHGFIGCWEETERILQEYNLLNEDGSVKRWSDGLPDI